MPWVATEKGSLRLGRGRACATSQGPGRLSWVLSGEQESSGRGEEERPAQALQGCQGWCIPGVRAVGLTYWGDDRKRWGFRCEGDPRAFGSQ